jgi:hypothetical protein
MWHKFEFKFRSSNLTWKWRKEIRSIKRKEWKGSWAVSASIRPTPEIHRAASARVRTVALPSRTYLAAARSNGWARAWTWRVGPEPLFLFSPSLAALAHRTSLEGATTSLSDRLYGWTEGDSDHAYKTPIGLCWAYLGRHHQDPLRAVRPAGVVRHHRRLPTPAKRSLGS